MPKKDFKETVQEEYPEFVDDVQGLSVSELERRLSTYAKEFEKVVDSQEADEQLAQAQALSKELGAPYRDSKKAIKLKNRYIVSLIKEKGGA